MKKLFVMLMSVVILAVNVLPLCVSAESTKNHRIEYGGFNVDIPADLVVFTQEISDSDPEVASFGWSASELSAYFKQNDIYMNVIPRTGNWEVLIRITDSTDTFDVSSFAQLSQRELEEGLQTMLSTNSGISYKNGEIYRTDQIPFLKLYGSTIMNGLRTSIIQYVTVNNNRLINTTIQDYTGSVASEQAATMESIVRSINFTKVDGGFPTDIILYVVIGAAVGAFVALICGISAKSARRRREASEMRVLLAKTNMMNQKGLSDDPFTKTEFNSIAPTKAVQTAYSQTVPDEYKNSVPVNSAPTAPFTYPTQQPVPRPVEKPNDNFDDMLIETKSDVSYTEKPVAAVQQPIVSNITEKEQPIAEPVVNIPIKVDENVKKAISFTYSSSNGMSAGYVTMTVEHRDGMTLLESRQKIFSGSEEELHVYEISENALGQISALWTRNTMGELKEQGNDNQEITTFDTPTVVYTIMYEDRSRETHTTTNRELSKFSRQEDEMDNLLKKIKSEGTEV